MIKRLIILLLLFICHIYLFADNTAVSEITADESVILDEVTGFPVVKDKPFIVFNEGFTSAWITRIQKQTGRSNFVLTDNLFGLYYGFTTRNMMPVNSTFRLSAFYPATQTFNKVPQIQKQVLRYAFDVSYGTIHQSDMWNYVRITFSPILHVFYQMNDRFHYVDFGIRGQVGVELPLTKGWTILTDGNISLDYGNLGSNKNMEPYDIVYQYQLSLGVRYSRKDKNKYSYIK